MDGDDTLKAPRTDQECVMDGVLRAQGLLGQLSRYVEAMENHRPPLDEDQLRLVHAYARKEAARLQGYIASISSALLELQAITGATQARPSPPLRKQVFTESPRDDLRRKVLKAHARGDDLDTDKN